MKYYDKLNKKFIFNNVFENESGIYFLDNCSDYLLNELNILRVNEPEYNPEYQTLEYIEEDGIYKGIVKDTIPFEQYQKEKMIENFKREVQYILDSKAKEHGYDDIVSACSYAGYENDFQEEGIKFGKWRVEVWKYGYSLINDESNYTRNFHEIIENLPKFENIDLTESRKNKPSKKRLKISEDSESSEKSEE